MATTYCGQFLDVVIGSPQTGQPQLLGKLCERRVSEQRHVTQQLMTYVTAITINSNASQRHSYHTSLERGGGGGQKSQGDRQGMSQRSKKKKKKKEREREQKRKEREKKEKKKKWGAKCNSVAVPGYWVVHIYSYSLGDIGRLAV